MNVRRTKTIVWLFNALTILCVLFVLVSIVKKEREGEFKPRKSEVFMVKLRSKISTDDRSAKRSRNIIKYSALWKARIDGSRRKDPNLEKKKEPDVFRPKNEPISNVLEIAMILSSPQSPKESKVRLRYLKENELDKEKELVLHLWSREGDPLKSPYEKPPSSGKVLRIEESQVVFSWFGEETSLGPKSFVSAADKAMEKSADGNTFPEDPLKKYRRRPPKETVEVATGQYAICEDEYKRVTKNPEALLDSVSLTTFTNPETGAKSIKAGAVKQDSLAHRRGVRQGDVLISINGIPISSKAGAINYFKQNPNEGKYTIEIDRMGRRVYKTYYYER